MGKRYRSNSIYSRKNKMRIIAYTAADKNNMEYVRKMTNSFHHFHPDIEMKIYTELDIKDPINWYKQKPLFAKELIKDYDLVIGFDADQIITGDLSYMFDKDYDVAVVNNFCRSDIPIYGAISVFDIPVDQYMNCGMVAMKSAKFINNWWNLCNSFHFQNMRYREQDLLNLMIHFGDWKVLPLDRSVVGYNAWHGLLSKGEWLKMKLVDGKLILPKAKDNYPESDKEIKVMHWAGGNQPNKLNYRITCTEEVIEYLDKLVKERTNEKPFTLKDIKTLNKKELSYLEGRFLSEPLPRSKKELQGLIKEAIENAKKET